MDLRCAYHWYNLCHTQRTGVLRGYTILFVQASWSPVIYWIIVNIGCWITARYPSQRIALEYLWLWITAFVDLVVYASLALILKGFVIVNRGSIHFTTSEDRLQSQFTSTQSTSRRQDSVAMRLLFYPAVYIITVSPNVICMRYIIAETEGRYFPSRSSGGLHSPTQIHMFRSLPPHSQTHYLHHQAC